MEDYERKCFVEFMMASPREFLHRCKKGQVFVQKKYIPPGRRFNIDDLEKFMMEDPERFLNICEEGDIFPQTWINHKFRKKILDSNFPADVP